MTLDPEWMARRRAIEQSRYWIGPGGRRPRWRKAITGKLLMVAGFGLRLVGLYGRGLRNALDPRRVEIDVVVPGLPSAFDGYRILHVSDTHLDVLPELVQEARRLLDGLEVDMLALTGDVHGRHPAPVGHSAGLLAEALQDVRVHGPRLAVLGNHDAFEMVEALAGSGFEVLINRSRVLEREGERLRFTGLDDVHQFYTEAAPAAFDEHEGECRIALVHSAELADVAERAGYGLYLCGHTHGGQVCLPGGKPVVTQLTRFRHAAAGLWQHGGMTGYTSRGLGVSSPTVRFNSRGEVAVITLRREMDAL
jgi:uncharacterized protein